MIERIDLPVVAGPPGSTLPIAGDTVMLLSAEASWIIRIRYVFSVARFDDGIAVLTVLAERQRYHDDHNAKQSHS